MKLTFRAGKFVLTGTSALDIDADEWDLDGKDCVTTDFKVAARYVAHADERARKIIDRAFVKHYPPPSSPLPPFLDPHQKEGVAWVLTRSRSYLAHAPGAGKTMQAIVAAMRARGTGQAVFIVPPSLTVNWAREFVKTVDLLDPKGLNWYSLSVIPDSGRQVYTGWNADYLIVPDSMLTKPWVLERLVKMPIRFIAVDEASRFKEATAQRTIALFGGKLKDGRSSPGLIAGTMHAVLMDGSPMPNRPMELWAPTYAMSPESIDFKSREDFGFRYCGATMNDYSQWEFKRDSNSAELKAKLQKDFMHVVPESALGHPERRRSILFMSEDARSPEHKTWERKHLHTVNFDEISEDMSQGDMATFRAELGMRKAPWTADYISERLTNKNESILLFAWHRDVMFELERLLRKYHPRLVMGGTPSEVREKYFRNFQSGLSKLLILNIGAGGRGHNLQRADRVVFHEFSWSDETNIQCEKRTSRKGNEKLLTRCDYIVCPNSMDEPILNGVFKKADRTRRIIG